MAAKRALRTALHAVTAAKGLRSVTAEDEMPTRQGRYKDPSFKTLSVYIPRNLHTEVKVAAAQDGVEMSGLVERSLRAWLETRNTAKNSTR